MQRNCQHRVHKTKKNKTTIQHNLINSSFPFTIIIINILYTLNYHLFLHLYLLFSLYYKCMWWEHNSSDWQLLPMYNQNQDWKYLKLSPLPILYFIVKLHVIMWWTWVHKPCLFFSLYDRLICTFTTYALLQATYPALWSTLIHPRFFGGLGSVVLICFCFCVVFFVLFCLSSFCLFCTILPVSLEVHCLFLITFVYSVANAWESTSFWQKTTDKKDRVLHLKDMMICCWFKYDHYIGSIRDSLCITILCFVSGSIR